MPNLLVIAEAIVSNTQTTNATQSAQGFDWFSALIPLLTVIISVSLSVGLSFWVSHSNYKKKQRQLRYDKFYAPYITFIYAQNLHSHSYSSLNERAKDKFIRMIVENIQYMGEKSQELVHDLFVETSNLARIEDDGKENTDKGIEVKNSANNVFRKFTNRVINESIPLSDKLDLPKLAHTYILMCNEYSNE